MVGRKPVREQGVDDKLLRAMAPLLLVLGLAACTGHPVRSQQQTASAAPAAPAQGPVNPDADVTSYSCADGKPIVAGYPDYDTAIVTYKDHAYTLKRVPSSRGARYTGYGLQWWTKGGRATLSTLKPAEELASDPGMVCFADDVPPAKTPAAATSFTPANPQKP